MSRAERDRVHHVTISTGHVAKTAREDVSPDVIAMLRPLVNAGVRTVTRLPHWHCDVRIDPRGGCGTILLAPYAGVLADAPIRAFAWWSGENREAMWKLALDVSRDIRGRLGKAPPTMPWLAVDLRMDRLLAGRFNPFSIATDLGMIGDLERCLFWTMVSIDGAAA